MKLSKFECGFATIVDDYTPFPCYYLAQRETWNGWACPMFTIDALNHVKRHILSGVIMPPEVEELENDLEESTYCREVSINGQNRYLYELVGFCFEECDEKGEVL